VAQSAEALENNAHVTNLIYLVPFLSLVLISVSVGEKILPSTLIGLIFIVGRHHPAETLSVNFTCKSSHYSFF